MKKKFGLLMLISTGILLGLTGCGDEKLDMNQFVTYEFVGYDGYGSVVSDFDDKEFISELVLLADPDKNIDESEAKDNSILAYGTYMYPIAFITSLSPQAKTINIKDIANKIKHNDTNKKVDKVFSSLSIQKGPLGRLIEQEANKIKF